MFDKYFITRELFTCHTSNFPNVDSYLINITLRESYLLVTKAVQVLDQMIKGEVALQKNWNGVVELVIEDVNWMQRNSR